MVTYLNDLTNNFGLTQVPLLFLQLSFPYVKQGTLEYEITNKQ